MRYSACNEKISTDIKSTFFIAPNKIVRDMKIERFSSGFSLSQNYPNPFNRSTLIRFRIPLLGENERGGFVTLNVYDLLRNKVVTPVDEYRTAGSYEVEFSRNLINQALTGGMYFISFMRDYSLKLRKWY